MNKRSYFWKCAVMGMVGLLLLGVVTMFLWNWLVPALFNGPVLNYWQTLGLLVLSKILTGSIWSKKHHYGGTHQHNNYKERFQEKLSTLDPVEREAFKQKMNAKWCSWEKQQGQSEAASND